MKKLILFLLLSGLLIPSCAFAQGGFGYSDIIRWDLVTERTQTSQLDTKANTAGDNLSTNFAANAGLATTGSVATLAGRVTDVEAYTNLAYTAYSWGNWATNGLLAESVFTGYTNDQHSIYTNLSATVTQATNDIISLQSGTGTWGSVTGKVDKTDAEYTNAVALAGTALQAETLWNAASNSVVYTNDSRLTDSRDPNAHDQGWSTITGTPTTVSGYGITDALNTTQLVQTVAAGGTGDVVSATGIAAGLDTKVSNNNGSATNLTVTDTLTVSGVVSSVTGTIGGTNAGDYAGAYSYKETDGTYANVYTNSAGRFLFTDTDSVIGGEYALGDSVGSVTYGSIGADWYNVSLELVDITLTGTPDYYMRSALRMSNVPTFVAGEGASALKGAFAFGSGTAASGYSSAAFGSGTAASGYYSAAFGSGTAASGYYSAAFGSSTTASGEGSAAFGGYNTASGYYSAAFGGYNTASGVYSAAFGSSTTASGEGSAAFGSGTTASGEGSAAFGSGTAASGYYSAAFGRRGKATHTGSTVFADSQDADFNSATNDTFNVRAQGGVYFQAPSISIKTDTVYRTGITTNLVYEGTNVLNIVGGIIVGVNQ